jgi:hypothetical protein
MTASTRRIRYIGRNHDTPDYRPTPIREKILPMERQFTGPSRVLTWGACVLVALVFWTAFFCWVLS